MLSTEYLDPTQYPDWVNFWFEGDTLPTACRPGPTLCLAAAPEDELAWWVTRGSWVILFTQGIDRLAWFDAHTDTEAPTGTATFQSVVPGVGRIAVTAPEEPGCYYLAARRLASYPSLFYENMNTAPSTQNMRLWNNTLAAPEYFTDGAFTLGVGTATPSTPYFTAPGSLEVGVGAAASDEAAVVVPPAALTFAPNATYRCDAWVYVDPGGLYGADGTMFITWKKMAGLSDAVFTQVDFFKYSTIPGDDSTSAPGLWFRVRATIETGADTSGIPGLALEFVSGVGSWRVDEYNIYRIDDTEETIGRSECINVAGPCNTLLLRATNADNGFWPYQEIPDPDDRFIQVRIPGEVLELGKRGGDQELYFDTNGTPTTLFARMWRLYTLRTGYLDDTRHRLAETFLRHDTATLWAPHWLVSRRYVLAEAYDIQPVQAPWHYPHAIATAQLRLADLQTANFQ